MRPDVPKPWAGDAALQLAMETEKIGRDYYDAMAGLLDDPQAAQLCKALEKEEAKHFRALQSMRSQMASRGETVMLSDEWIASARQAARQRVIPSPSEILRVVSAGRIADVLGVAIEMEEDAISYYRTLAGQMSVGDSDVLYAIIREEEQHLQQLRAIAVSEG
ncbi:MAG: ferritin-like domain-containing protein [Thermoleophilia bacterium]